MHRADAETIPLVHHCPSAHTHTSSVQRRSSVVVHHCTTKARDAAVSACRPRAKSSVCRHGAQLRLQITTTCPPPHSPHGTVFGRFRTNISAKFDGVFIIFADDCCVSTFTFSMFSFVGVCSTLSSTSAAFIAVDEK